MELTLRETVDLFRAHWAWIAEHPNTQKNYWQGHDFSTHLIMNHCFLCQWVLDTYKAFDGYSTGINCGKCPIDWGTHGHCTSGTSGKGTSLYSLWCNSDTDSEHKKSLALTIAQLPLTDESMETLKKPMPAPKYKFTDDYRSGISFLQIRTKQPCIERLHQFASLLFTETAYKAHEKMTLHNLVVMAGKIKGGIDWLVDNGFIEKNKAIPKDKTYRIGNKFYLVNEPYELVAADENKKVSMISINTGYRTNAEAIQVSDLHKITQAEFDILTGEATREFTQIKNETKGRTIAIKV
jgi:hypothetical protein